MLVFIFVMAGFIYGYDYFKIDHPYGLKDNYYPIGKYLLSIKWWNIELNWFTHYNNWQVDIKIRFITRFKPRKMIEYVWVFRNSGFKFWIININ